MVKYSLWGTEVDLDLDRGTFPSDEELKHMDDALTGVEHGWFKSPAGHMLHYRKYVPECEPRAICVFQHGVSAHSGDGFKLKDGRLVGTALLSSALLKAGYALYTPDLLGHGFSEGTRFYIPDWKVNRDDFDSFARFAASQHSDDIPLFLAGESYGGTLAVHVARKWQDSTTDSGAPSPPKSFRGLALLAPAVIGDLPPWVVVFVLRYLLKPLCPKWTPFFMPNPISPDRIWSDPEVRERYTSPREREMRLDGSALPFRLGTGASLLSALECVRNDSIPDMVAPFCIVHGTNDDAVPIEGAEYMLEHSKTASDDRTMLRMDGALHDLLGEPKPRAENTVEFMIGWMDERIGKSPAF